MNLSLRPKNYNKGKTEPLSPHSRKLSNDENYERDLIALDTDTDVKDGKVISEREVDSSKEKLQKEDILKMEFSFSGSSQESVVLIPDIDTSSDNLDDQQASKKENQTKSKPQDHFSFIDTMLAAAKSYPTSKAAKTGEGIISNNDDTLDAFTDSKGVSNKQSSERSTRNVQKRNPTSSSTEALTRNTRTRAKQSQLAKSKDGAKMDSEADRVISDQVMPKDCRLEANGVAELDHNGLVQDSNLEDITISSSPVF